MPKAATYKVNYQGTNITESDINNPDRLEEIGDNIVRSISISLEGALLKPLNNEQILRPRGYYDIYDNVFIDGVSVYNKVKETMVDDDYNTDRIVKLCAVTLADAQVRGKEVTAKSAYAAPDEKPIPLTFKGDLPQIKTSFSFKELWDKFCAFFNIGNSRERAAENDEARKNKQTSVINEIKESEHKNHITDPGAVHANDEYYNKIYEKYKNFNDKVVSTREAISIKYAESINENLFDANKISEQKKTDLNYKPSLKDLPDSTLLNGRLSDTVCMSLMMMKGHSVKDLSNPDFTHPDQALVAKEYAELTNELTTNNKIKRNNAEQKLQTIIVEGAKKFLEQPVPPREEYCYFPDAKDPCYVSYIPDLAKNFFQELSRSNSENKAPTDDPAVALLRQKVGIVADSGPGRTISMASMKGSVEPLIKDKQLNKTLKLELGKCFGAENMVCRGENLGELAALNQKHIAKNTIFNMHYFNNENIITKHLSANSKELQNYGYVFDRFNERQKMITGLAETIPEYTNQVDKHNAEFKNEDTLAVSEAKLALATKTINAMMSVKPDKPQDSLNAENTNKMIKIMLNNNGFKSLTNKKTISELSEMGSDIKFLTDVSASFVVKKEEVKVEGRAKALLKQNKIQKENRSNAF